MAGQTRSPNSKGQHAPKHALILHYISLKACFTHPVRLVACQFIFLCTHCFIFLFSSSAILLYHFVATPLCTTLKFSDHVVMSSLTLLSPNSLCSGQLSSRPSFQPIILGGKRVSAPILTDVATLVTADYRPWISCYPWSPGPEDAECIFCHCCLNPGNT